MQQRKKHLFDEFIRVWDTARGHDLSSVSEWEAQLAGQPDDSIRRGQLQEAFVRLGWADRARAEYARALALAPSDLKLAAAAQRAEAQLQVALHSAELNPSSDLAIDPKLAAALKAMGIPVGKATVKTDEDGKITSFSSAARPRRSLRSHAS